MSKTKKRLLSLCSLSLLVVSILAGAAVSTGVESVPNKELAESEMSETQKTVIINVPSDKVTIPLAITDGTSETENTGIVYKESSVTIEYEEDPSIEVGEGELLEEGGVSLHN